MLIESNTKKIPILMYHSISQPTTQKFTQFCVPPMLFAKHMIYLYQYGYTTLTVTQFIRMRMQGKGVLPERPVILTFDDGFADFFTEALPVLQRYGFIATLYIATAFVNGRSEWIRDGGESTRLMLTWEQLWELNEAGIEIGAHSHNHHQLDILPFSLAQDEIVRSKRLLEEGLGQEVLSFAYPHGYHSPAIQQLVRDSGYTSACAVKYEMNTESTDPFALARLKISSNTGVDDLAMLLSTSCPGPITKMYKRARIPVWRLVRRFSNMRGQHV